MKQFQTNTILFLCICALTLNACSKTDSSAPMDDSQPASTQTDTNDDVSASKDSHIFSTASLSGSVVDFTASGCTVTPVTEDDETATVAAPGSDSSDTNVTVTYEENCLYQIADIYIETSKTVLTAASVSDIKKQTSLLLYGDYQDQQHLTVSKVIITHYH